MIGIRTLLPSVTDNLRLAAEMPPEIHTLHLVILDADYYIDLSEMWTDACQYQKQYHNCRMLVVEDDRLVSRTACVEFPRISLQSDLTHWKSALTASLRNPLSALMVVNGLASLLRLSRLPGRKQQILELIRNGESVKNIADMLNISAKTVYSFTDQLKEDYRQPTLIRLYHHLMQEKDEGRVPSEGYKPPRRRE